MNICTIFVSNTETNDPMGKRTEKKSQAQYNQTVINTLIEKYDMSAYYIKQCVAGRRQGITPDNIKKDYNSLSNTIKEATNQKINQFLTNKK